MKKLIGLMAAVACAMTVASAAHAQSLTTLFAANNWGNLGNAVYFDVSIAGTGLTITGFDTNTLQAGGINFGFDVYLTAAGASYLGNETIPGAWTLVASGTGTAMGQDIASPVAMNSTFNMAANTSYGMALVMGPTAEHAYTNGPLGPYSNADLSLALGSATNIPFTGNVFNPRVWNGTIYYQPIPGPAGLALLGLAGMCGRRRRR